MPPIKIISQGNIDKDDIGARRVPALLSFLHPFRLVLPKEEGDWTVTIDDVNNRSWDYEKMHRVVGGLDVGLRPPLHMIVGFDGSLALPPCPETTPIERGIDVFNKALAAVLLGGIYCEAIGLADVAQALILDWKHIRLFSMQEPHRASASMIFHASARTLRTPPDQATSLIEPQSVSYYDFWHAHDAGCRILKTIPEVSPELLLKGVSAIAHREWSPVLSNMTIVNEQLTSILWDRHVLKPNERPKVRGRLDQLKDTRAWSAATRQELLFQKEVLSIETLNSLFVSRQARNHLVHRGIAPREEEAMAAYSAFKGLLEAASGSRPSLFAMAIDKYGLSGPYDRRGMETHHDIKPTHWLPIPPLPNEAEINRQFAKSLREAGQK